MSTSRRLDLKYRPRRFSDVLGNEGVKRVLLARSSAGTLADQSLMFGGPKGCGKTTLARIVARAMKCSELAAGEPCGTCSACVSIIDETNRDVEELDAASQGTVDKVREMVGDSDFGSFDGTDLQVYVVDEAQRLSKAAQDAFLKAIESRLFVVVMCTTEPEKIQGPIRDRVEEYSVRPPSADQLSAHLRKVCDAESIEADDAALSLIVETCGRTPRTSLRTLEAVAVLGRVTEPTVRDYGRFESFKIVERVLSSLDSDVVSALAMLDELSVSEGPTWIRDALVSAVRGAHRDSRSLKSHFPVKTSFFPIRGGAWLDLASKLSGLDRPSIAGIEVVLLSTSPVAAIPPSASASPPPSPSYSAPVIPPPVVAIPPPPPTPSPAPAPAETRPAPPEPLPPPPKPPLEVAKPVPVPRSIEVDGIKFTDSEALTSLDEKVIASSEPALSAERMPLPVEFDAERVPISESEFSASFIRRLQGGG